MQISRRVTNGLAWAGVALVVGVPTADAISAHLMDEPERVAIVSQPLSTPVTSTAAPVREAEAAPVPAARIERTEVAEAASDADVPPAQDTVETASVPASATGAPAADGPVPTSAGAVETVAIADPVDDFLSSGRSLPAYISGGADTTAVEAASAAPSAAAPSQQIKPAANVAATSAQAADPTEPGVDADLATATAEQPVRIAPVPAPLSQRPQPQVAVTAPPFPVSDPSIVIPDSIVTGSVTPASGGVVPPAVVPNAGPVITADELRDWESGPLSDFLARHQQAGSSSGNHYYTGTPGSSASFQQWPPQHEQPQYYIYPLR